MPGPARRRGRSAALLKTVKLKGNASLTSVNRGGQIKLFVSTIEPSYTIDVYRMGWYGGAGARLVIGNIQRPGKAFFYCGYVWLRSATGRCGKNRLLEMLGMYSNGSPTLVTNPTPAILYRGKWPVLLLDEADNLRGQDKDTYGTLIQILNGGYAANGAVPRAEKIKDEYVVVKHSVYGPKAFAGIEGLADTLSDRTFAIQMQRVKNRLPKMNRRIVSVEAEEMQRRISVWAMENAETLKREYDGLPDIVPELERFDHRFQYIAEPLIVIASRADWERPEGLPGRTLSGLGRGVLSDNAAGHGRCGLNDGFRDGLGNDEALE